jgi:hypothetical protein
MRIKKVGEKYTVYNEVDEATFERLYKPKGWVVDESKPEITIEQEDYKVVGTNEEQIKNVKKMRSVAEKQFDDNLIKKKD